VLVHRISGVTGKGVAELMRAAFGHVRATRKTGGTQAAAAVTNDGP
jgi:hypothetical protein